MRCLILLSLIISTSLSAASIRKWVDEEGTVHYGDAPPMLTKTEPVRVLRAPTNPGKALPRLKDQENVAVKPTAAKKHTLPKDQAKKACERARGDLEIINQNSQIKVRMADGTSRYMSTAEIEKRKIDTKADVKRYC